MTRIDDCKRIVFIAFLCVIAVGLALTSRIASYGSQSVMVSISQARSPPKALVRDWFGIPVNSSPPGYFLRDLDSLPAGALVTAGIYGGVYSNACIDKEVNLKGALIARGPLDQSSFPRDFQKDIVWPVTYGAPSYPVRYFPGRTALLPMDGGNIAHDFQKLVSFMSLLLGNTSATRVALTPVTAAIAASFDPLHSWMSHPALAVLNAVASAQARDLNYYVCTGSRCPLSLRATSVNANEKIVCFEELVLLVDVFRAHAFLEPTAPNMRSILSSFKTHLFAGLNLREHGEGCLRTAVIYGREDQRTRTLVNANMIEAALQQLQLQVVRIMSMPSEPTEQQQLFNSADIVVMPHGAAAYNAIYMHDSGHFFELGVHSTWWGIMMAHLYPSGPYYEVKFPELVPEVTFNASFHQLNFTGERAFELSSEGIKFIVDAVREHVCRP